MPKPASGFQQLGPIKPAGAIRLMLSGLASFCSSLITVAIIVTKEVSDHLKIKLKPIMGTAGFFASIVLYDRV